MITKKDIKKIKIAIKNFNKKFANIEPLYIEDFTSKKYYQYYVGHVTDNGNISLMFPITSTPDLAHIVFSPDNEIIKTNKAFEKEIKIKYKQSE
jgi:hypothetical protein